MPANVVESATNGPKGNTYCYAPRKSGSPLSVSQSYCPAFTCFVKLFIRQNQHWKLRKTHTLDRICQQ